eukprot:jgi/Bigna1/81187/fgenesh1_pg.78_\
MAQERLWSNSGKFNRQRAAERSKPDGFYVVVGLTAGSSNAQLTASSPSSFFYSPHPSPLKGIATLRALKSSSPSFLTLRQNHGRHMPSQSFIAGAFKTNMDDTLGQHSTNRHHQSAAQAVASHLSSHSTIRRVSFSNRPAPRRRLMTTPGSTAASGDIATLEARPAPKWRKWVILFALVLHKTLVDQITDITRKQGQPYSEGAVSLLAEVMKLPLLVFSISAFGGGADRVVPSFKGAGKDIKSVFSNRGSLKDPATALMWISLLYGIQNLLYFNALSNLSAVAYQALSQTKTVFTAIFMVTILGRRLSATQWSALGLLIVGMIVVQSQEMTSVAAAGGNALLGGFFVIVSSLLSALPNVYYEKILKLPKADMWRQNLQITWWIFFWVLLTMIGKAFVIGGGLPPVASMISSVTSLTPWVWLIVALKALNGVLIPLTLKYTDNILYSYAKPSSIVLTCVANAAMAGRPPSPVFAGGVAAVVASIVLYNR